MTAEERVQIAALKAQMEDVHRRLGCIEAGQAELVGAIHALRLAVQEQARAHPEMCNLRPRVDALSECVGQIDVRLKHIETDRERIIGAVNGLRWMVGAVGIVAAAAPWLAKLFAVWAGG